MTSTRASDAELLERWARGETEAGQRFTRRYAPAIARFFRNKTSAPVEDLVQQTFCALLEGRERIVAPDRLRSYLFGIAHNILRAHLRQLSKDRQLDEAVSSIAGLDPGPVSVIARRREQQVLLRALRQIPVAHQVALELYYWEELTTVEIAEVFGVSASTMRSRMLRARELLREQIHSIASSKAEFESTTNGLEGWAEQIRISMAVNSFADDETGP